MNDYISKPIDPDQLERMLRKWIRIEQLLPPPPKQKKHLEQPLPPFTADTPEQWDYPSAIKRVRNKPERLCYLAQRFVDAAPNQIKQIEQFCNNGDFEQLRSLAHMIKGVSANLSAVHFSSICEALEMAAPAQDTAQLHTYIEELKSSFIELENILGEFIENNSR